VASTIHRIASATAGLAILAVLTGFAGGGDARGQPGTIFITSPAFPDGAPIPVRYACRELGGQEIPPPLAWSALPGAGELALVMEDLDAPGGVFVHWIVIGINPAPGSTAPGQIPTGGSLLPNGNGDIGYRGPCPPAGTGTHHYRFSLYEVPADFGFPGGGGEQAAQAIAQAEIAMAQYSGTFVG
jgi:Raf kinase inhibitor-like YbhB/YbcL family protein